MLCTWVTYSLTPLAFELAANYSSCSLCIIAMKTMNLILNCGQDFKLSEEGVFQRRVNASKLQINVGWMERRGLEDKTSTSSFFFSLLELTKWPDGGRTFQLSAHSFTHAFPPPFFLVLLQFRNWSSVCWYIMAEFFSSWTWPIWFPGAQLTTQAPLSLSWHQAGDSTHIRCVTRTRPCRAGSGAVNAFHLSSVIIMMPLS